MSRASAPFRPAAVLALIIAGAAAFLLFLYALAAGWDGRDERDGGAHAASNSLTGFAALARLLEAEGHAVSLSRSPGRLDENVLLVVTPPHLADAEQLAELVQRRRYLGPTLLILPKWGVFPVPDDPRIEAEEGWVVLGDVLSPDWLDDLPGLEDAELATGATSLWQGLGLTGELPELGKVQAITADSARNLTPLVVDGEGDMLATWRFDGGYYPVLAEASRGPFFERDNPDLGDPDLDEDAWPLVIIIEPDLLNNHGMADPTRARAALALVDATLEDYDLPIVFDLTIPGLGRGRNLLTLAFAPPFLAATLCLLLAAGVIAWRAFLRFGPPRAETPALARGKTQLARNGAGLVERAKRLHLLGAPYAAMVSERLAARLGISEADPAKREAALDRALAARGAGDGAFSTRAQSLRSARRPGDLLRAAADLGSLERTMQP